MPKSLFVGLFSALIMVVFAVQNAASVTIKLFFWELSSSLSLVIIICIVLGSVVGSAFTFFSFSMKVKKKAAKEKLISDKALVK